MGTQGTGRKRSTKKDRSTAEDDALNLIAREAEARLAAKRAARAEAREIRMKELERQQKEIFQVQKKYYGLNPKVDDRADSKWGDIEQWMEDSEKYSRASRTQTLSDEDERMSVGSRGSVRSDLDTVGAYGGGGSSLLKKSKKKKKHKHKDRDRNGYDDDYSVISSRSSRLSDESRVSRSSRLDLTSSRLSDDSRLSRASRLDLQPASYASSDLYSLNGLSSSRNPGSAFNGYQSSLYEDSLCSGSRRVSTSHPLDYSSYRSSGSRASSRASSARASPVDNCGSVASFLRSSASGSGLPRDLDDVTIPDFSDVEDRDYLEKGSRAASALTAATLTSLGGSSSRRGSGETALTVDAESSLREIKEIHELKDQIQDVESKYTQNLKEVKDALAQSEEKYRKAMVSNAQLDNEKNNLMYQVDTLKDSLMELEELLSESRREYEEKVKEYEREKHAHGVLQFQFNEMKETLKQSEDLLNDIRQLRMKQEGFVREISDLQETVEWKDKKIGALERQKEYTDAIRVERDELREEVVKLKDVLKKHGIVLGPDLNVNGEAECEATPAADSASQPAHEPLSSPTEGNSMLGNTEETEFRSSRKEDADPEQQQEKLEESKENLLNSDEADGSKQETSDENHLPESEEISIGEDSTNKDFIIEPIVETTAVIVSSSELQENVLKAENSLPETVKSEESGSNKPRCSDSEDTGVEGSAETRGGDFTEKSDDLSEKQDKKCEDAEETDWIKTETCHQQTAVMKEGPLAESVPALTNTEPQQDPENTEEAENEAAEETPSNANKGKKRKKKRKGKKKGVAQHGSQNQHSSEKEKESGNTVKAVESGGMNDEGGGESHSDSLVSEESKVNPGQIEQITQQDGGKPPQSGSQEKSLTEPVAGCEEEPKQEGSKTLEEEESGTPETLIDTSSHKVTDEEQDQTEETHSVESVTDSRPLVETHTQLRTESRNNDQDGELGCKTGEAEAVKSVAIRSKSGDSLSEESTCVDNAESDSTNSSFVNTDSKPGDGVEDKPESVEESGGKSSPDPSSEEKAKLESLGSDGGDDSALECDSMNIKSPAAADTFSRVSESESPAAMKSQVHVLEPNPQEGTERVSKDEAPRAATEEEADSEVKPDETGSEDQGVTEPGESDKPKSSSLDEESESCSDSPANEQPAADSETVEQSEALEESQTEILQREDQRDETEEKREDDHPVETEEKREDDRTEESEEKREDDHPEESEEKREDDHPVETEEKREDDHTEESEEKRDDDHPEESEEGTVQQETTDGEDPQNENRQQDEKREPSPAGQLEGDEEDDEDEGQSFDFDDLDVEAAELPHNPEEEEFEEAVEATSEEVGAGGAELRPSDGNAGETPTEAKEETRSVDRSAEGLNPEPPENRSPEAHQESENELQEAESGGLEEAKRDLSAVVDNIKQRMSSLVEEAFDVVSLDLHSDGRASSQKSNREAESQELPQAARGGRKGSKKGKGKGKEDCKVS